MDDKNSDDVAPAAAAMKTARWKRVAGAAAGAVIVVTAVVIAVHVATTSNPGVPPPGANSGKTCPVAATNGDPTTAIQTAIQNCASGGTVSLAAGTYAVSSRLTVKSPETIKGAGSTSTFIVQHSRQNIFQITAPGVTIEDAWSGWLPRTWK